MDFAFSDEQLALRAAARDWLADHYPFQRVVELAESPSGFDPAVWGQLRELGWVDPSLSVLDTALLFEQTGYALLPAPLFSSVALGLPGAGGERASTLATKGEVALDGSQLSGRLVLVPDVAAAQVVLVATGSGLYEVARDQLAVTTHSTLDRTRRLSELTLAGAPARRVADPEVLAEIRLRAGVAVACEAVGVAQRMLDLAAEHARTREQFGRPIGSYQAVSHPVADMYVALELARSLAYWAAWCVSQDDPQREAAVAAASWSATEAAVTNCERAIQVHGGLGFTYDAPLHRYYKRAQWLAAFSGGGAAQRRTITSRLLAGSAR